MKKHYGVEVVRKQNSQLTRTEIHDVVVNALELVDLEELPIAEAEGFSVPVDELEQVSSGISEGVEFVTVYLEKSMANGAGTNKVPDKVVNGDADDGMSVEDDNAIISSTQQSRKHQYTVYVFELDMEGEEAEYMDDGDEDEGQSAASHHWLLPSRSFHGLWDSLIFESDIKNKLIDYVRTAVMFSTRGVNSTLVSWNKVILLHGPPGTGKTSLCKALAQKAVITLQNDFLYGQLVEINSHSLFSKWFSESGKLVTKMFDKIMELVEDPKGLVFLLIDEVESLAQCRQSAEMGNEPTDSIRAVNALLTQIDRVKKYPNVLILTTSNIVGTIDLAFVDRADLKLFIGHPPAKVIYGILASCVNELIRVDLVKSPNDIILPCTYLPQCSGDLFVSKLYKVAEKAVGLSGRSLRKLPFITFANHFSQINPNSETCSLSNFLDAMSTAVDKELMDRQTMENNSKRTKSLHNNSSIVNGNGSLEVSSPAC